VAKTPSAAALGVQAEAAMASWYAAQGYEILARNWRTSGGEIDIVAALDDVVVIVEVKARSSARFGTGLDAITPTKLARLHRLGRAFLREHAIVGRTLRVDVASWVNGTWDVVQGVD
jgi:putative endonuclease